MAWRWGDQAEGVCACTYLGQTASRMRLVWRSPGLAERPQIHHENSLADLVVTLGIRLLFVALKLTNTFPRVNSVVEGPYRVIV